MSASFAIFITGSPSSTQAHHSALRFAKAALQLKHTIRSIFFYQEACHVANKLVCQPTDETNIGYRWVDFATQHQIELQVCVAAANRRGVLSHDEADAQHFTDSNLLSGFSIVGLGQLAAALAQTDTRLVHFK